jgi:vacuolar-type H+-ATPase subunit F/Vma7
MKLSIHAVGRAQDILPYLALGAQLHEVDSPRDAAEAVREAVRGSGSLVIVSEEFAEAADEAPDALTFVVPGIAGAGHAAVEKTRELVSRSVGVDLIAKADRTGR